MKKTKALKKIDQPIYRYWQALYLAFWSPALYVDVGKRWKGLGIIYLFFVLAVMCIPFGISKTFEVKKEFYDRYITPFENVPPIYIQSGEVFLDEPMPYEVRNNKGEVVLIVDTSGKITTMDAKKSSSYPDLFMLITKNKILFRVPAKEYFHPINQPPQDSVYEQNLGKRDNEIIDMKNWLDSSGIFKAVNTLLALVYPGIVFAFFGMYLTLFLAFSLMGQFIAKLYFNMPLTYKQASRLLTVSATPYFLFIMLLLTFNISFPGSKIILFMVLLTYFCFAVWALRKESHKMVPF